MANREIVVIAPINIALIKYWGKRDGERMLPLNDSISINIDSVYAKTRVSIIVDDQQGQQSEDSVVLNGKRLDLNPSTRFAQCFGQIRRLVGDGGVDSQKLPSTAVFRVESETNFPTSAGLASSAAGFAAIAYGLGRILDLDTDTISGLARFGSGSACRSIYGGFVHWVAGVAADGSDCVCRQLTPTDHWSNLRAVVVVVNSRVKRDSSTNGMQRSVETSQLFKRRLELIPQRIDEMKKSIADKNFATLADGVMKDSNQLHAICADTYPPMFYLTDASCHLIDLVHAYNEFHDNNGGDDGGQQGQRPKVAYTFDAGPNCCLLMEEETVGEFLPYLCHYCPNRKEDKFIRGSTAPEFHGNIKPFASGDRKSGSTSAENGDRRWERLVPMPDSVEYVIVSKVGGSPHVIA